MQETATRQPCNLTDEQIERIALDTLAFFGVPEYDVALSRAEVLGFARAVLEAASRQTTSPG